MSALFSTFLLPLYLTADLASAYLPLDSTELSGVAKMLATCVATATPQRFCSLSPSLPVTSAACEIALTLPSELALSELAEPHPTASQAALVYLIFSLGTPEAFVTVSVGAATRK